MAQANERKGILRHLWSDRIAPAITAGDQASDRDERSGRDAPGRATGGQRPAEGGSAEAGGGRILTPEERILQLVSRHGGRMRQAEIVSVVEWSESTVSRKLQGLESTGDVTRYQLGREKLVYLPGHEPAALASPLSEEEENAPIPR